MAEHDFELFVPGRICLFGEHSDWAGGYRKHAPHVPKGACIVSGTTQGLWARVRKQPPSADGGARNVLTLTSSTSTGEVRGPHELPLEREALLAIARAGGYWSYAAGVAHAIIDRFEIDRGLVVDNFKTSLPSEKGLSSSAALCVLLTRAFSRAYNLRLTVAGEMELAYLGERTTPSQCGRMDQCVAYGVQPVLMEFDGDAVSSRPLALGGALHLVIAELGASKDTVAILSALNGCYPHADTELERGVHALLGAFNLDLVGKAVDALRAGEMAALGALMREAQAEFDLRAAPACPAQLTSPLLHRVLAHAPLAPHVWGGKGVGSQGDGCAQLLARSADDALEVVRILKADFGMECLTLSLGPGTEHEVTR